MVSICSIRIAILAVKGKKKSTSVTAEEGVTKISCLITPNQLVFFTAVFWTLISRGGKPAEIESRRVECSFNDILDHNTNCFNA